MQNTSVPHHFWCIRTGFEDNIAKMIAIAGGTSSLRPHIKTHKTAEIIRMQMRHGIQKFKCATIAEAELLAQCGAQDILLAMQPVGFHVDRFFSLMESYPGSHFSTLVDNPITLDKIAGRGSAKPSYGFPLDGPERRDGPDRYRTQ